jgi:iron complex transport system substrate-binding protein
VRIVSLLPSATEILHAIGLGSTQVGRSHECDDPPEVQALPVLTRPRCPSDGRGSSVDERIRWLLRNGLSVYHVDEERLMELRPDALVTQDQCAVCAVTPADLEHAVETFLDPPPTVITLRGVDLEGVWQDVTRVGEGLGASRRAHEVVASARARLGDFGRRAATSESRPTVALIEWLHPLMAAGNWIPELVDLAGGRAAFGWAGVHSPWLDPSDLVAADPDVVILIPCGYALERTMAEAEGFLRDRRFAALRAVRSGRLYAADGHAFFNRPGPRLVESTRILGEILHPDLFPPTMERGGWVRLAVDR